MQASPRVGDPPSILMRYTIIFWRMIKDWLGHHDVSDATSVKERWSHNANKNTQSRRALASLIENCGKRGMDVSFVIIIVIYPWTLNI